MHQESAPHIGLLTAEGKTADLGRVRHTPSWRYYAILASLGILLGLFFRESYIGTAIYPVQLLIAEITASLLAAFDLQVIQQGTVLMHRSGFACEITPGCTGLISLMLYAAAVLMYPARISKKITGLIAGALFLIVLNFIRLIHLVYVGAHHISWFDFTHEVVWQSLMALAVVGAWWVWTSSCRRSTS